MYLSIWRSDMFIKIIYTKLRWSSYPFYSLIFLEVVSITMSLQFQLFPSGSEFICLFSNPINCSFSILRHHFSEPCCRKIWCHYEETSNDHQWPYDRKYQLNKFGDYHPSSNKAQKSKNGKLCIWVLQKGWQGFWNAVH